MWLWASVQGPHSFSRFMWVATTLNILTSSWKVCRLSQLSILATKMEKRTFESNGKITARVSVSHGWEYKTLKTEEKILWVTTAWILSKGGGVLCGIVNFVSEFPNWPVRWAHFLFLYFLFKVQFSIDILSQSLCGCVLYMTPQIRFAHFLRNSYLTLYSEW